jgi:hypothetical protein
VALSPASVVAQQPEDCVTCANAQFDECIDKEHNPRGYAHYAIDHGHHGQIHRRNEGTHNGYYCFSCSVKHPPNCRRSGPGNPPPLYEEEIEEIQAAAAAHDALGALRIALRQPHGSPIRFSPERTAIQVRGCDERFVTLHVPLGHLPPQVLATALAAADGPRSAPLLSAGDGEPRQ